jgi:hypothetical protein
MNTVSKTKPCDPHVAAVLRAIERQPPSRRELGEWLMTERGRRWRNSRRRQIRSAA